VCFVLLITGVGSLIHIYSIGYMEHDPDRRRFFGYLNLFVASMLLLVLADSYLLLYVGWEGVGLASYLLIGFWNYNPEPRRPRPRRRSWSTGSATSGCRWRSC
jgi:NADH-quinone oxidoreductase subunit L